MWNSTFVVSLALLIGGVIGVALLSNVVVSLALVIFVGVCLL